MKKIVFLALATAAVLSFGACNNSATKTEGEKTTPEVGATAPAAGNEVDKSIDTYEALTVKYVDLMKKVKAGDASAAIEAQKVTDEYTKAAQAISTGTLTPAQTERFVNIAKKMQEELTK